MRNFFEKAVRGNNPLRLLAEFLAKEKSCEEAKPYDGMRLVGYGLDIDYDTATIVTNDRFKVDVGGVPRNSFLIMVPFNIDDLPLHFTLLRVLESAPTPLSQEEQQTYFELHKRAMPEVDIFTQSHLQWGALKTGVLGMFYQSPDDPDAVEFSGDLNNFVSPHKYRVYAPDKGLLHLIVNAMVPKEGVFDLGELRMTECRLTIPGRPRMDVDVTISTNDFMGTRTAMFGKTRLGKSNVVKLIAQSLIETTGNVGQLIFDINGEYANDNPQDDSKSLAGAYPERCVVYALTKKEQTPSRPLRIDFYEHPDSSHKIIGALLKEAGKDTSIYISMFLSADIPSLEALKELPPGEQTRARRKVLMYWAILHRAGFPADPAKLSQLKLDPGITPDAREAAHGKDRTSWPPVNSLDALAFEFEKLAEADRKSRLKSSTGKDLFDAADQALLGFLKPASSSSTGPGIIQPFKKYHDPKAGDFVAEIIKYLNSGRTVVLDLGNAPPEVMEYFSAHLSKAVFIHQVEKFSNNRLGEHYLQLYFEEAHNLFPAQEGDEVDIYRRLAKEGAKYHIGMVYSTQSVTTINKDLLAQTENFFIAHLSSLDEVNALARVNVAYESLKGDILQAKTPGYIRMLTRSHRFVVPVQARKFRADRAS